MKKSKGSACIPIGIDKVINENLSLFQYWNSRLKRYISISPPANVGYQQYVDKMDKSQKETKLKIWNWPR